MKNSQILEKIQGDFATNKVVEAACVHIYEYFCTIEDKDLLKNLSFRKLKREARSNDDKVVHDAIIYFLGERVNLLNVYYIFFDENTEEIYDVDYCVLLEASKNQKFYHPETEELVEDFGNKIFQKYSISDSGRRIT